MIVDHTNIFVLVEVMAYVSEEWRKKTHVIYFQKLCNRVFESPETMKVDLAVMNQWIKECKDKWKVEVLKN